MTLPIILASQSPRRIALLKDIGLRFRVVQPSYMEEMSLDMAPASLAKYLSLKKAQSVFTTFNHHIVIGADTLVVLKNQVLGKPITPQKSMEMLKAISNQCIKVITGFTVIHPHQTVSKSVTTHVFIKPLSTTDIKTYVATGEPLDKAGAFAIQGRGAWLIRKIEGDYLNVVGLPVLALCKVLTLFFPSHLRALQQVHKPL